MPLFRFPRRPRAQTSLLATAALLLTPLWLTADPAESAIAVESTFLETDGLLVIEAEHFLSQKLTENRAWYLTTETSFPDISPDADPPHASKAGGNAYLEILPDTRRTHDDPLVHGVSFANSPGRVGVLTYRAEFTTPGRYYVWVRAYSTGTEDNGIHVGLNGEWPASGQRLQWCEGKHQWWWESRQRTQEVHCGVPHLIYLDIPKAGVHDIHFSMREDGFEFDRFLLTTKRDFPRPEGLGPPESRKELEWVHHYD